MDPWADDQALLGISPGVDLLAQRPWSSAVWERTSQHGDAPGCGLFFRVSIGFFDNDFGPRDSESESGSHTECSKGASEAEVDGL